MLIQQANVLTRTALPIAFLVEKAFSLVCMLATFANQLRLIGLPLVLQIFNHKHGTGNIEKLKIS